MKTEKIRLNELNPHEKVIQNNLKKVIDMILSDQVLKKPIIVDKNTNVILDGHHRYEAFKVLGERRIPCIMVDYSSEEVNVEHWGEGSITKEEVVEKGLSNELFEPKTSRHTIPQTAEEVDYPLSVH